MTCFFSEIGYFSKKYLLTLIPFYFSHAIVTYLVDKYANNDSLYPKDLKTRATVNQRLFFNNVIFLRVRDRVVSQREHASLFVVTLKKSHLWTNNKTAIGRHVTVHVYLFPKCSSVYQKYIMSLCCFALECIPQSPPPTRIKVRPLCMCVQCNDWSIRGQNELQMHIRKN